MRGEELKKKATAPFNELWQMFWKCFKWGERSQEEWDHTINLFNEYVKRFEGTDLEYIMKRMSLSYLGVLQWADREGEMKNPNSTWCLTARTRGEVIEMINKAKNNDEIIIKGSDMSICTKIKD